ncbi:UDP-glucosyltransferase A1 [Colletotrichum spinosum]|uniref:UDP-glucosyltransferase A1 n=1 Tax=Colletotrichum spinosum TaxID=1347390 RepID=A0A4R8PXU6_9PEZI|nr:UDP-glucosyltransferase A1 [Colletotrichum spinosum]
MTVGNLNRGDTSGSNPLLLFAAFPGEGHTNPLLSIASYLVKTGYEVVFMAPDLYQTKVEETGAGYLRVDNPLTGEVMQSFREATSLPRGLERVAGQYKAVFLDMLPMRTQSTEDALVMLQARDPSRQIIFMEDVFNSTLLPFKYGRPLPEGLSSMPKSIGFGVAPLLFESRDNAPMSLGLLPDSTVSGRQRNEALHKLAESGPFRNMIESWQGALRKLGCTVIPDGKMFSCLYTAHDYALQLCSPSLEYPLSDLPSSIKYVGLLPRKTVKPGFEYPPWWPEVERKQESKYRHVVFVSQGTLNPDYTDLILPSLDAFVERQDVLVVATLGARGTKLPSEIAVPSNARVVDYIPYDIILEYTDVFISNAGYGTFTHAVSNGVPVVLAGENEEKIEVTMRAIYADIGLSLETQTPTAEQVRKGVQKVLSDSQYKKAAVKLKMENENLDSLSLIEDKIRKLIA